ncbi:MAG: HEPN domain-containing protein [Candidatus Freyarchaeota archaeon]|nr:HEPN domain-containing protein [Candidatus Jordarchaeia archaeon]MBS7268532.1 HEPN domain-containing protein [Candidatus Jordarchaeia archaeon]MBS7279007.1 HEPN domain-containing protein [Candidatus Jordarchaeia archaeon]
MLNKLREKVLLLLEEAQRDDHVKCYNKAVSAAYFAARMAAESFIAGRMEHLPRRDDKLANVLRNIGFESLASTLMELYKLRKKADYGEGVMSEGDSRKAILYAKTVIEALTET